MELAIAQTAYGLAVAITSFIAEHDDKDAVNKQISDIVVQIQNIIHPLLSQRITNTPLQQCLQGLQIELSNTHEHMKMWKERRSRRLLALINPWAVTQQLKDDQKQLMDRYHLLIGAMQVFHHLKENSLVASPSKVDISQKEKKDTVTRTRIEVLDFWEMCIGRESVTCDHLLKQLSSWMGTKFNAVARQRLLLYLDNNYTDRVNFGMLQDLIQDGNVKEMIENYCADPTLPLLIWISDDIITNTRKIPHIRKAGITVVQLGSTSAAKAWLRINREFIKKHDNPADIRFLSDQVRTEFSPEGVSFTNWRAGQEITKFIREEGFLAPILILTAGRGLVLTRYVEAYKRVGSLVGYKGYKQYVDALGARRKDDTQWAKYGGP